MHREAALLDGLDLVLLREGEWHSLRLAIHDETDALDLKIFAIKGNVGARHLSENLFQGASLERGDSILDPED